MVRVTNKLDKPVWDTSESYQAMVRSSDCSYVDTCTYEAPDSTYMVWCRRGSGSSTIWSYQTELLQNLSKQWRAVQITRPHWLYDWSLHHSSITRIEMQIMQPNELPTVTSFCLELPIESMRVEPSMSFHFYIYAHVQLWYIFTDDWQTTNLVYTWRCSFIQTVVHMYSASVSYMNISITKWSVL